MLLKIVGSWVRGLYLMGIGCFWLFIAFYLSGYGRYSPSPIVLGVGAVGGLLLCIGLVFFVRGLLLTSQRVPLPQGAAGWRDTGEKSASDSGFDPDAAIARYLERRVEPVGLAPRPPVRPSFGRKQG
jgi:hypothetical protein